MSSLPFVEKYRPTALLEMKYNELNQKILHNSLKLNKISNMIFYGPPGTGKTTVIINFVNEYLNKHNLRNKGLLLHLNASDERGIDIIRNNILTFVRSDGLLSNHLKFVILDEADSMTKTAQTMLQAIIEKYYKDVRIFMICNYISKIDNTLLSEFIILRFNQLNKDIIKKILTNIISSENIAITSSQLESVQAYYHSDIRSMINSIQYSSIDSIPSTAVYSKLYTMIKSNQVASLIDAFKLYAKNLKYTTNNLIHMFIEYLIEETNISSEFLIFSEIIYTNKNTNTCVLDYACYYLCDYYKN